MKTKLTPLLRTFLLLIAAFAFQSNAAAQILTLAIPHWNITLTDFGYSDFPLDNTPGFEGRDYLSGEWGAAVGCQVSGDPTVPDGNTLNDRCNDSINDSSSSLPREPRLCAPSTLTFPAVVPAMRADNAAAPQSSKAQPPGFCTIRTEANSPQLA